MTTEEIVWNYLKELINRSLIQVTELIYEGLPYSIRIHDLLREVIVLKSREQNMMTIATGQQTRWPEKVRRLVVNNFLRGTKEIHCFNHLRSLITFGSMEPLSKTFLSMLLSGKLIKVLNLRDANLEEIRDEIWNLFHLKYLCLRGTSVKTIPKSIGKLQNLEYLDLGETDVRELPMEILKLEKLLHLWAFQFVDSSDCDYGYYGFIAPSNIGWLLTLHTLHAIDVGDNC